MARMTKEEIIAANRARAEAAEVARVERVKAAPLKLLKLIAQAEAGNYCSSVDIGDGHDGLDPKHTGPVLRATFNFYVEIEDEIDGRRMINDSDTVYVTSDDWQFDTVSNRFKEIEDSREAERKRIQLARETYDSLSPEQRKALGLTRRP